MGRRRDECGTVLAGMGARLHIDTAIEGAVRELLSVSHRSQRQMAGHDNGARKTVIADGRKVQSCCPCATHEMFTHFLFDFVFA